MEIYKSRYRIPSARLINWDYGSPGLYFVTINTKNRESYFGEIVANVETQNFASLRPSPLGMIARHSWNEIPDHFPFIELDEYVIMPDHVHGIVLINKPEYNDWHVNKFGPQSKNLGSVIRGFKVGVKKYAVENKIYFEWQSRYYDHIIRSENELNRIREYIIQNPSQYKKCINAKTNHKNSDMTEKEQDLRTRISEELLKQFPDHQPKIAGITEYSFTYELEKQRNYTYYVVKYELLSSGEMTIDWKNAELTVI